jgi:hypothetical protein
MDLHSLLRPTGILAFLLFFTTFLFGLKRWNFKVHKRLAVAAVIAACIHALLVIVYNWPDVF